MFIAHLDHRFLRSDCWWWSVIKVIKHRFISTWYCLPLKPKLYYIQGVSRLHVNFPTTDSGLHTEARMWEKTILRLTLTISWFFSNFVIQPIKFLEERDSKPFRKALVNAILVMKTGNMAMNVSWSVFHKNILQFFSSHFRLGMKSWICATNIDTES